MFLHFQILSLFVTFLLTHTTFPVLSIFHHFPLSSRTSAKPSEKVLAFSHWQGITTLPVLSIKPHLPLASFTAAKPSEKDPASFHWQGITTLPVLSIKPHLPLASCTRAKPSEKEQASFHWQGDRSSLLSFFCCLMMSCHKLFVPLRRCSKVLSLEKTQNSFGFFLAYSYLCSRN